MTATLTCVGSNAGWVLKFMPRLSSSSSMRSRDEREDAENRNTRTLFNKIHAARK